MRGNSESMQASHSLSAAASPIAEGPLVFVRERLGLIAFVWVAAMAAGGTYLWKARPLFTSSATVYVQPMGTRALGADKPAAVSVSPNFLNTQKQVLTSVPIVATALGNDALRSLKTLDGVADPIAFLRAELRVEVGKTDDLLRMEVDSPYAEEAPLILNAIIESYVKFQSGQQRTTSSRLVDTLRKEKGQIDARAADLDRTMRDYQKQAGTLSFDERPRETIAQQLLSCRQELTASQLKTADAKAAYEEALLAWGNKPLPTDDVVKGVAGIVLASDADQAAMRAEMARAAEQLETLRSKLLPQHPAVKDAVERLETQKARYLVATRRHVQVAERAEATVRQMLAAEEKRAADFAEQASQYARLDSQKRQIEEESSVLGGRIKEVKLDEEAGVLNVSVLDAPAPGIKPTRPNRAMVMLLAMAGGLAAGLLVGFVRHHTDPVLRSSEELEAMLKVPVLGCVPAGSRTAGNLNPANPVPMDRWSDNAETCRQIASAFSAVCPRGSSPAVLITSPRGGDGRSTVARDLAIALAGSGQRVLLVDADFQNPSLHALVGTRNLDGLSTVLSGELSAELAILTSSVAGLEVLTTGPTPALPAAMFDSPEFEAFLAHVATQYDRVLLDAPAVGVSNDARIAALACGATLLVLPRRRLLKRQIRDTRDRLVGFGAPIVGIILNNNPRRRVKPQRVPVKKTSVATLQSLTRMVADGHEKAGSRIKQITSSSHSSTR